MSSYNRRYAILQDKNLKSSEVESVKSVTTPPTVSGVNQSTKTEMYGESSLEPGVDVALSNRGDASIVASGSIGPRYAEDVDNSNSYTYFSGFSADNISGSGFVQTDGSSDRSRFSFKPNRYESNAYQIRTTPNYFNKVPFTMEYEINGATTGKSQCYTRPTLLSLNNGNMLSAYLDSYCPPWMWTYRSNMLDNGLRTKLGNVVYTNVTNFVITYTSGTDTSALEVGNYFTSSGSLSRPVYYKIVAVDLSSSQFTISPKGSGPPSPSSGSISAEVYSVTTFQNRPAQAPESNVKIRLSLDKDKFWSTENTSYPVQVSTNSSLDLQGSDDFSGCTGISMVQFPDTDEILVIYCGYRGKARNAMDNSSFLCVDELTSDTESYSNFAFYINNGESVDRRGYFQLNKYDGYLAGDQKSDIYGIDTYRVPLSLSAEVLPSGRLVVVVAFTDKLYSLVSDDRGCSFSATEIMDLQFGDSSEYQQFSNVDTCVSDAGRLILLLTANSIGSRGMSSAAPSGTDPISESVVSIFVTDDGHSWSSEKRLGGGENTCLFSEASEVNSVSYPYPNHYRTHIDESVYCLSGSVCMTPEQYVLVSVCSLNIGGPGNPQGCHVMQRTLSVDEIPFGSTGSEIAPSISSLVYSAAEPVQASISRFGMAAPYVGTRRDNTYEDLESIYDYLSVTYEATEGTGVVYATTDRGYLGSLYFSGIRQQGIESLPHKLYGGGPILMQGPIDIATTLHGGEVISLISESWERTPADSPNSDTYINSRLINKDAITRGLYVVRSDGFQPLNVRIPTEIRRFEACYGVDGKVVSTRFGTVGSGVSQQQFDGQIYFDVSSGLQQNYVHTSSLHVDVFPNSYFSTIDLSVTRYIVFSAWNSDGIWDEVKFTINSVTEYFNPNRWRITVSPYSPGANLDNVYDGFNFRINAVSGDVDVGVKDNCQIFGSNCYQVSLLGSKNPIYWGWDHSSTSSTFGSSVVDIDSSTKYAEKWQLSTSSSQDVYVFVQQ